MKKKIRINYVGFWPGFNPEQFHIIHILKKYYELEISDHPDYLFCSVIPPFYEYMGSSAIRIMYSGENYIPDLNSVDYAISSYPVSLYDRCFHMPVSMNHPDRNLYLQERSKRVFTEEDIRKKDIFANFCASHDSCDGKRLSFFKQLSEYKKIDSIGTLSNNTGTYVKMRDGSKWEYQKRCKFSLCFESVSHAGFNTEKISDAFYTDTIPVYLGDPHIGDIYNTKAFINVSDYESFDAAIERIIELDNDDEKYLRMLNESPYIRENYADQFERELEEFLLNIFEQPHDQAYRRARNFIPAGVEHQVYNLQKLYYKKPVQKTISTIRKIGSLIRK